MVNIRLWYAVKRRRKMQALVEIRERDKRSATYGRETSRGSLSLRRMYRAYHKGLTYAITLVDLRGVPCIYTHIIYAKRYSAAAS